MTTSAYPVQAAATAAAGRELAREFATWQIDFRPGALDVVAAYWCSPDGRSRRYVVRHSSADLVARLREIDPGTGEG
jgi:hypothetical protein